MSDSSRQNASRVWLPGHDPTAYLGDDAHRKRESVQTHFESFGWVGDPIHDNESVLLVDDVITQGHTSAAARELILASTSCRSVLGLLVARTM